MIFFKGESCRRISWLALAQRMSRGNASLGAGSLAYERRDWSTTLRSIPFDEVFNPVPSLGPHPRDAVELCHRPRVSLPCSLRFIIVNSGGVQQLAAHRVPGEPQQLLPSWGRGDPLGVKAGHELEALVLGGLPL